MPRSSVVLIIIVYSVRSPQSRWYVMELVGHVRVIELVSKMSTSNIIILKFQITIMYVKSNILFALFWRVRQFVTLSLINHQTSDKITLAR